LIKFPFARNLQNGSEREAEKEFVKDGHAPGMPERQISCEGARVDIQHFQSHVLPCGLLPLILLPRFPCGLSSQSNADERMNKKKYLFKSYSCLERLQQNIVESHTEVRAYILDYLLK